MPLKPREALVLRAIVDGETPESIVAKHTINRINSTSDVHNITEKIRHYYDARTTAQAVASACTRGDLKARRLSGNPKLTGREQGLLNGLADGEQSVALAERYGLGTDKAGVNKIDWQIRKLVRKLKAENREHAIYRAWRYGLLYAEPAEDPQIPEITDAELLEAIVDSPNYKTAVRKLSMSSVIALQRRVKDLRHRLGARTTPQAVAIALKRRMLVYPPLTRFKVDLDDRELVACRGTADGLSQRQIARELGFKKEDQVTTIMTSAKRKLGARNLEHCVVRCHQLGLL